MPEFAVPTSHRRRGRPRGGDSGTRDRILGAAVDEFGAHGYDGATVRGIAHRAGVDSALVHHYFGTKADLFAEVVGAPMRPDIDVPALLAGPLDELGERIARYVIEAWERPETRRAGVVLLRGALGNRLTAPLVAGFLSRELFARIALELDAPDAELRASLVGSQVAGLLIGRHVLKLKALATVSVDELVGWIAPTLQRYLTGDGPDTA